MALLERSEWYDIARATNWTPTYVSESELFPELMTGAQGVPMEQWESYDEPYKTSYPEYVKIQREKDAGAYSVKAALERSRGACGELQAAHEFIGREPAFGAGPAGERVADGVEVGPDERRHEPHAADGGHGERGHQQHPPQPKVLYKAAQGQHEARERGELLLVAAKHLRHLRHDIGQQTHHYHQCHNGHNGWVNECSTYFLLQGLACFQRVCQFGQDTAQVSGVFAGCHRGHIHFRECFWILCECLAKWRA